MPSRSLTDREPAVARLIAMGRTRADIASELHIAPATVDAHVLGVMGAVIGVAFGIGFGWATGRAFLRTQDVAVSFPFLQIAEYVG
jgi:FixJ family two-component response regulator